MVVLAQTYLHLDVHPSSRQMAETRVYLEYLAARSAVESFGDAVELEFRVEEGSLKGWLQVIGGLVYVMNNYGSLRQSVDYAVHDAKAFSEYVIEHFKSEVSLPPGGLYRAEKRLGLPGRLQRLYPLLDEATKSIASGEDGDAQKQLEQVQEQLNRIADDLASSGEDQARQQLEREIPQPVRDRLPIRTPEVPQIPKSPRVITDAKRRFLRREKPRELLIKFPTPPKPPSFR